VNNELYIKHVFDNKILHKFMFNKNYYNSPFYIDQRKSSQKKSETNNWTNNI